MGFLQKKKSTKNVFQQRVVSSILHGVVAGFETRLLTLFQNFNIKRHRNKILKVKVLVNFKNLVYKLKFNLYFLLCLKEKITKKNIKSLFFCLLLAGTKTAAPDRLKKSSIFIFFKKQKFKAFKTLQILNACLRLQTKSVCKFMLIHQPKKKTSEQSATLSIKKPFDDYRKQKTERKLLKTTGSSVFDRIKTLVQPSVLVTKSSSLLEQLPGNKKKIFILYPNFRCSFFYKTFGLRLKNIFLSHRKAMQKFNFFTYIVSDRLEKLHFLQRVDFSFFKTLSQSSFFALNKLFYGPAGLNFFELFFKTKVFYKSFLLKDLINRKHKFRFFFENFLTKKNFLNLFLLKKLASVNHRAHKREAFELAWFFYDLVKLYYLSPFLRSKLTLTYPVLWKALLIFSSTKLRAFLERMQHSNIPAKPTEKPKEKLLLKTSLFSKSFFKNNIKFNQRSPRVFEFFLSKLKQKYGFKETDVPFRLDVPLPRYRIKKQTDKLEMYKLLKVVRRYYGNMQQKRFWNIRKIVYNKSKGFAFFNQMLFYESRLDIFLIRARLCNSIAESRQFIAKGWICVNGRSVFNYNMVVTLSDIVSILSKKILVFKDFFINRLYHLLSEFGTTLGKVFPVYLEFSYLNMAVCYIPKLFSVEKIPTHFNFNKIIVSNWGKFSY